MDIVFIQILLYFLQLKKYSLSSYTYGILPAFTSAHHMSAWCPWRLEEVGFPKPGAIDGCGVAMCVQGIKPESSVRVTDALHHGVIS